MTALTLEEIASSNGGGSIATSDGENDENLPDVFEEIDANIERVEAFRDHSRTTDDNFSGLVEFARDLRDDDGDLWSLMEKSRELSDLYRIEINHIRGQREGPFIDEFKDALFGDSDDPDPGTKNYVDQKRRSHDTANLAWYKVMFPEPVEEHYAGQPVVWMEFDEIGLPVNDDLQDSHIYVTREWAESYMDYGEEIAGQVRPLPPEDVPESTATALDPSEYNVTTEPLLEDALEDVSDDDALKAIYEAEKSGENRKGAKAAINDRREEVQSGGDAEITLTPEQAQKVQEGRAEITDFL